MSAKEVYRQVAVRSIQQYRNLTVLGNAWLDDTSDDWPSWIPRWDRPGYSPRVGLQSDYNYNASGSIKPILVHSPREDSLILQGLCVDTIVQISPLFTIHDDYEEPITPLITSNDERLTANLDLLSQSRILIGDRKNSPSTTYGAWSSLTNVEKANHKQHKHFADFSSWLLRVFGTTKRDAYVHFSHRFCDGCRHLIVPPFTSVAHSVSYFECLKCSFDICTNCYVGLGVRCSKGHENVEETVVAGIFCRYSENLVERLRGNAEGGNPDRYQQAVARLLYRDPLFFRTEGGTVGVGIRRPAVRKGDKVVVLFGGRVPFVVRRVDGEGQAEAVGKGEEYYRLLGQCYAHGAMDGEAIEKWKGGEFLKESFELR